jgi:hypothetical protein
MADNSKLQEFPLTFEKGLVTEVEESTLELGQASELLNWEPVAGGGLRARNAWKPMSKTGLSSPYSVRGFGTIATGAGGTSITAPVVAQADHWPNANADPIGTRTVNFTGVNIGSVLVAVVTDDSGETPSVTAGWTQRAVGGSAAENYVKFYTKTAASSSESFSYTIVAKRIRAMSVYELQHVPSADPGSAWAVQTVLSGSPGSSTITATTTDTDGGIGFVGYYFDGGTPDTSDSGTAGWATPTLDNANTRLGVTFEDLDLLDGHATQAAGTTLVYTSPSWTPPTHGIVIVLFHTGQSTSNTISAVSVSGNSLTWHDCLDGGELGVDVNGSPYPSGTGYAWADCSLVTGTTGTITVSVTVSGGALHILVCTFVRAIGGDTTAPFRQKITQAVNANPSTTPLLSSALADGSGLLGEVHNFQTDGTSTDEPPAPTIGVGNWSSALDSVDIDADLNNYAGVIGPNQTLHFRSAYCDNSNSPDTLASWIIDTVGTTNTPIGTTWEIKGSGNPSRVYRGAYSSAGSAIEGFSWAANKRITAKSMFLGFTPPASNPDLIDFYIVMAVASSSTHYKVYRIIREDILTGTWELLDELDATNTDAWVTFAQGAGKLVWSATTMAAPRLVNISGGGGSNISQLAGKAGRSSAYHKDRMFIGGSIDIPGRLYFSAIGDPNNYTTATDFLDIGGDDGEALNDLVSVEGLLMVCKNNRLYLISGSGIESFFVNELPGGTAASGRPAIRTPYGTIVVGPDDIWVVQGGGVDPMSRPLGGGFAVTGNVSTAYAQDSVIVVDATTGRIWRVNLVTGSWAEEDVKTNEPYITFSLNGRLYYGANGSTTQVGGKRQLTDSRDYDTTSDGNVFHAATGKLALVGPSARYTARHLYLQLRNHNPGNMSPLHVTVESNLLTEDHTIEVIEEVARETLSLGKHRGAEWLKVRYVAGSSATAGAVDVEKGVIAAYVERNVP